MNLKTIPVCLAGLVVSLTGQPVLASQCAVNLANVCPGSSFYQTINLVPAGSVPAGRTEDAADEWTYGCINCGYTSGCDYPEFIVSDRDSSDPQTMNVYVNYVDGRSTLSDGSCGHTDTTADQEGRITGAAVTVFQFDADGNTCSAPEWVAHELGHVLGLGDVDDLAACDGTIMGHPINDDPTQWGVDSDDCQKVSDDWLTPEEQWIEASCESECQGYCENGQCIDEHPSPIVIDIGGHGYHLSGVDQGVRFDLTGDGHPEQTAWTAGSNEAFLCLDRNHNGLIDNGRELFGNYTLLPDGKRALNGYEALAAFDDPALGGNGDHWISSDDAIWPFLRLWIDRNHDGISQPDELLTLDAAGVVRIDTHHYLSKHRDQYGNLFRYRGRCVVRDHGEEHDRITYDIFFVAHP